MTSSTLTPSDFSSSYLNNQSVDDNERRCLWKRWHSLLTLQSLEVLSAETDRLASWKTAKVWLIGWCLLKTERRGLPIMVKTAQTRDVGSEPVMLIRILRDGISWEVRDAGHAET